MNNYLNLDISYMGVELDNYTEKVKDLHNQIHNKTGKGNDFLGWVDLPINFDKDEFERVKAAADKIKKQSEAVVLIGIGGSYLGVKSAVEMLKHNFKSDIEVLYAGHHISSTYLSELVEYLEDKKFSIVVVSKSGTTTEPALAFRVLKKVLKAKFDNVSDRIYAITDKERGALKQIADQEGYETFVIPDDVGGRYSVLTPVGLLGMAIAGIDIDKVMEGATLAYNELLTDDLKENIAYQYAVVRSHYYVENKKPIELMVNYEPNLVYFNEWWKQLYGESEGKDGKGLFPASVSFSTDLHSLGQYIQDGERLFFETIINVEKPKKDIVIESDELNLDGLNYLEGKTMSYVNEMAFRGTLSAHLEGGVNAMILNLPEINEKTLGYMIYFFEKACAMSGYIIDVNPFDQPGVEFYKKNMFKLLGKPGF